MKQLELAREASGWSWQAEQWPRWPRVSQVSDCPRTGRCRRVLLILYLCAAHVSWTLFFRGSAFLELKWKISVPKFPFYFGDRSLKDNPNHYSYFVDSETEAREVKWLSENHTWAQWLAASKPGSLAFQISVLFTDPCCPCLSIQLVNVIEGTLISLAPKGFCG